MTLSLANEKKGKKLSKLVTVGIPILVIVGALAFVLPKKKNHKDKFTNHTVARGNLTVNILSTGVVQSENRLEIKPPIPGRVEKVQVQEGQRVKKGQILVWMSSTERAALLDSARASGPEEVKKWEQFYRPTPLMAPLDGLIISRKVEPGQSITTQEAVLIMSDRLTIKAQVDETDIAQVKLQQKTTVSLDAYPGQSFSAHVEHIAYDAKTVNNVTTYEVAVLPENPPAVIKSGMTANVNFKVASKDNVLLVPAECVQIKEGQYFVQVKGEKDGGEKKKSKIKPQDLQIEVGLTDGKWFEVTAGLSEGDTILQPKVALSKDDGSSESDNPFSSIFGGKKRKVKKK